MNDEIKEILEFKENADYKKLSCDEIKVLRDYITNLQQENEKLKRKLTTKKLFKKYKVEKDVNFELRKIFELQRRIEKAVEYIKYCDDLSVINDYSFNEKPVIEKRAKKDLLNIFNGRNDE